MIVVTGGKRTGDRFTEAAASRKYLIQHVYERASEATCATDVIVATDDPRIFAAVGEFGGRAVPPEDAGDASGLFNAFRNLGGSFALAGISVLQDKRQVGIERRVLWQRLGLGLEADDGRAVVLFFNQRVCQAIRLFAGIVILIKVLGKTDKGRYVIDNVKLHSPVFGSLLRKVGIARFTRTLGTLVASGVPILQALNIVRETSGNVIIANAVQAVHESVKEGETITAPLEASGVFPPMVIQMVGVGEATGALDAMLGKVADFYEDEVDNAVAALTSLMEPLMIALLGAIIGFIVVAMYLPIFQLANVFGKD